MDDALVDAWKGTVPADGTLINCGDVAVRWTVSQAGAYMAELVESLPGSPKLLIAGNHDLDPLGRLAAGGFDAAAALAVAPSDPPLVFTHVPMTRVPRGTVNVHGHVHGPRRADPAGRHINVNVERTGYKPARLDRLRATARTLTRQER